MWIIITLTFFLMKAIPGDPLVQEKELPPEIYHQLFEYYGFDKTLFAQYQTYLINIVTLNLGPSLIHTGLTASQVIFDSFPVSGYLGIQALLFATSIGVLGGLFSALKKNSWIDYTTGALAIILLSMPSFVLAVFLQYVFGVKCGIFPIARWESLAHTWLPSISLAAMPAAFLIKLVRANVLEVLKQDYIFFAKTKGLSTAEVVRDHVLKNALTPLFGYFGKMSANILVGSFIIEEIFCIPGLGYWFVSSISNRDYPLIMGLTIFYSFILLGILYIAEMAHAILDSRIYRKQEVFL